MKGREASTVDIGARFKRRAYAEMIVDIHLPKLTRKPVEAWPLNLMTAPVVIDPHAGKSG